MNGNLLTLLQCNSSVRHVGRVPFANFSHFLTWGIAHLPLIFRSISLDIAFRAVGETWASGVSVAQRLQSKERGHESIDDRHANAPRLTRLRDRHARGALLSRIGATRHR